MTRCGALYLIGETAFLYDLGENHDSGLKRWQMDLNVWCKMKYLQYVHRGSNLFDKRFFPVKYWIVIAYAVSCCLLPKKTPYDL